jgi:ankyrin repeat protein
MHPVLVPLLKGREDRYPHLLEKNYARVFNEVMALWGKEELEQYFSNLFLADRPDRQGFPLEVLREINFLHDLHQEFMRTGPSQEDVWGNESVRRGLEAEHVEYSEAGFFRAVESGNESAIRLFLQAGVDINLRNKAGWTPLMVATFSSNEHAANMLLDVGAKADVQDRHGYGPLHWSAYRGFAGVTRRLLDAGVSADLRSHAGVTPLLQAAAMGRIQAAMVLLKRGAHVSEPDDEGWTPLHKAVANGYADMVELLIKSGADPTARHASGATPASIAQQKQNPAIIALVCR